MSPIISNSLRLEIVETYYHSRMKKTAICAKYGISKTTLYRIIRTFAPVNKFKVSMSSSSLPSLPLDDTEEELLRLNLRIAELARDAYEYMIDLAEQRYHIRVRKNSDAK